jgi:hypothetical protein
VWPAVAGCLLCTGVYIDCTLVGDGVWPAVAGCLISDDLEGMWKEAVRACLKWYPGTCLEGLRKTTKQFNENNENSACADIEPSTSKIRVRYFICE